MVVSNHFSDSFSLISEHVDNVLWCLFFILLKTFCKHRAASEKGTIHFVFLLISEPRCNSTRYSMDDGVPSHSAHPYGVRLKSKFASWIRMKKSFLTNPNRNYHRQFKIKQFWAKNLDSRFWSALVKFQNLIITRYFQKIISSVRL